MPVSSFFVTFAEIVDMGLTPGSGPQLKLDVEGGGARGDFFSCTGFWCILLFDCLWRSVGAAATAAVVGDSGDAGSWNGGSVHFGVGVVGAPALGGGEVRPPAGADVLLLAMLDMEVKNAAEGGCHSFFTGDGGGGGI